MGPLLDSFSPDITLTNLSSGRVITLPTLLVHFFPATGMKAPGVIGIGAPRHGAVRDAFPEM
jgi:hypothetical protein